MKSCHKSNYDFGTSVVTMIEEIAYEYFQMRSTLENTFETLAYVNILTMKRRESFREVENQRHTNVEHWIPKGEISYC